MAPDPRCFFFFFQAEDGIRDLTVTGVQTCALPISTVGFDFDQAVVKPEGKEKLDDLASKVRGISLEVVIAIGHADMIGSDAYNQRSEERRVGKEGRSRWSPYH